MAASSDVPAARNTIPAPKPAMTMPAFSIELWPSRLQIVLGRRVKNADQRGERADNQCHEAGSEEGHRQQIGIDAENSIESEVQCGAGDNLEEGPTAPPCRREAARIDRHQSGLYAETEKVRRKIVRRASQPRWNAALLSAKRSQATPRWPRAGANPTSQPARRLHPARGANSPLRTVLAFVFEHDQQIGKNRHDLPCDQEKKASPAMKIRAIDA